MRTTPARLLNRLPTWLLNNALLTNAQLSPCQDPIYARKVGLLFTHKLWPTPLPTNIVTPNRLYTSLPAPICTSFVSYAVLSIISIVYHLISGSRAARLLLNRSIDRLMCAFCRLSLIFQCKPVSSFPSVLKHTRVQPNLKKTSSGSWRLLFISSYLQLVSHF